MTESPASAHAAPGGLPATGNARVDRMLHSMVGSTHLTQVQLTGASLALHYRADDRYFVSDEFLARLTIGTAFALLYRCGLDEAVFHFRREDQPVRLRVTKAAFNTFFALGEKQLALLASDGARFDASPVARVSEARQWEFYLQFTKD